MVLGDPRNQIVSTDHIGVPHGGAFGNVRKWEPVLAKRGLFLYWSLIHGFFGVYTKRPGSGALVNQMQLHAGDFPLPIDKHLVNTLIFMRETHSREDQSMVKQHFDRKQAAKKAAEKAKKDVLNREIARDAVDKALLQVGARTPMAMSGVPQTRARSMRR